MPALFIDGKMISGTVIFICNKIACHTFYMAQDYNFQEKRSLNLVLLEVIKWAHQNQYRYLNFGISTEEQGKILNSGLVKFKEGFGACSVIRRYYKKEMKEN